MEKIISVKLSKIFKDFFANQQISGIILVLGTIFSLIISNSQYGGSFQSFWGTKIGFEYPHLHLNQSITNWINDGLMSLFFLLVGIEIKRELVSGELSDRKKAMLPMIGALGGMIVPALLFLIVNLNSPNTIRGMGIPTATDIAFAIAILGLLGDRVPTSLKIFLTALAIIDDLGAILVIAIFYGHGIQISWILASLLICGIIMFLNYKDLTYTWVYVILGLGLWFSMLHSGIHSTIAGVIFAFLLPRQSKMESKMSDAFEHFLQVPVSFFILPLFAIANTAITLNTNIISELIQPLPVGIFVGLFIGKPIGIYSFCWIASKLKLATISDEISLVQLLAAGILGGIGFTMSIFITNLAFIDVEYILLAKISILISSIAAAFVGFLILKLRKSKI